MCLLLFVIIDEQLLELSNLNSQVTKIDGNFEKEVMLNYFQSQLLKNGFSNFSVNINDDFQTRNVTVNLDKNYLNNRSDVIND